MADTDAVRGAGLADGLAVLATPSSPGQPDAEPDQVMTLVDHLTELRTRIVRSVLAVVVGSAIGFVLAPAVRVLLVAPLPASALPLQVLGPGDAFGIQLRIALVVGVILAMPVLLYQLWAFVSPGLTPAERRALRPWIPLALFFFVLGVTIAYAILPFAIGFLLAFGLLMEFPIVLYAVARVGILSSARLRSSRRMIILGIAIFAAVATPGGDLVSPTILGGTMYLLFELTLIAIRRGGR